MKIVPFRCSECGAERGDVASVAVCHYCKKTYCLKHIGCDPVGSKHVCVNCSNVYPEVRKANRRERVKHRLIDAAIYGCLALALYVGFYLSFRSSHQEVWRKDGKAYVIFPSGQPVIYYLFRPLTVVDSKLTSMNFHIGPHLN